MPNYLADILPAAQLGEFSNSEEIVCACSAHAHRVLDDSFRSLLLVARQCRKIRMHPLCPDVLVFVSFCVWKREVLGCKKALIIHIHTGWQCAAKYLSRDRSWQHSKSGSISHATYAEHRKSNKPELGYSVRGSRVAPMCWLS